MDWNRPVVATNITVFDYETTGSVTHYPNEPWQIGLVTLDHGVVALDSCFESFLRVAPSRPFNPHAPGRHALLRAELADSPTMEALWPQLEPRLIGQVLCAHNVGTERKITREAAPMHRLGPWLDTLRIARFAWPGLASYALEDLTEQFGLLARLKTLFPARSAHDALYDAVASALLLEHLLQQKGWASVTVHELSCL